MVKSLGEIDPQLEEEEEDDDEVENISYNELKKRMWKDRIRLQKLKEKHYREEPESSSSAKQEASRRKKMSRAHDSILEYMVKIMEVCKAQGFVYGIVPEKGKPVTGSFDSLREWWKEKVRFDQHAPLAISEYLPIFEQAEPFDPISYIASSSSCSRSGEKRKCMFDQHAPVYDHPSIDTNLVSLPDCITMELEKADKTSTVDASMDEGLEVSVSTPMVDYASFWGGGIEDGAFEMLRENIGLNLNPLQDILHDQDAPSVWDMGYE
ncbi:hypothetical protein FH972_002688 [Carpinus fangiana]|uniref:Ethylene insensitive 3-like DNA-binding domain-containing protein n=1 Tax=Carpinus fangiana TaxID=176857 RepID=A0A5N6QFM0_9ROSI|nr:hypothetical protein FH972_002688 [Carpinus fangiana]